MIPSLPRFNGLGWQRLRLALWSSLAACTGLSAATKPTYTAAQAFGATLQIDYAQRKSAGLIEHIDTEAMRRRVFSPLGREAETHPAAREAWTNGFLPVMKRELGTLDHLTTLMVARVVFLADGDRALECVLLGAGGEFRLVTLRLVEAPDGHISICDLAFKGTLLEMSRSFRQLIILMGAQAEGVLDDEEIDVQRHARQSGAIVHQTLASISAGASENAFSHWRFMPPGLVAMPVWKDLRTRLAMQGSKSATESVASELRADPSANPFMALALATAGGDKPQTLVALDFLLRETQQLAFLRSIKAGLLLEGGRAGEAFALAWDVCELTPINGLGHLVALKAAIMQQHTDTALQVLRHWNHVMSAAEIDGILRGEELLAAFVASSTYGEWLQNAPQRLTAVPGSSPEK